MTAAPSTRRADCEAQIAHIDELVQRLEEVRDPVVRATGQELMQATMALHGAALERIVELVGAGDASGQAMLETLGRDELVGSVLVLYGLHPVDLGTRVEEALEKARPYLRSHGGNVELLGIDDGEIVRVRLDGSCHGCPASSLTLRTAIESAVREAAPEITSIVVAGDETAPAGRLLPLLAQAAG